MMYSSFPYNKPVPSYWVSKIPYIFHRITRAAKWPERPKDDYRARSGDFLFVDQSNFFLNDYADWQPSSRNTHQEYSFHLYSGGTSPPK